MITLGVCRIQGRILTGAESVCRTRSKTLSLRCQRRPLLEAVAEAEPPVVGPLHSARHSPSFDRWPFPRRDLLRFQLHRRPHWLQRWIFDVEGIEREAIVAKRWRKLFGDFLREHTLIRGHVEERHLALRESVGHFRDD